MTTLLQLFLLLILIGILLKIVHICLMAFLWVHIMIDLSIIRCSTTTTANTIRLSFIFPSQVVLVSVGLLRLLLLL